MDVKGRHIDTLRPDELDRLMTSAVRVCSYSATLFGVIVGYWFGSRFHEASTVEIIATSIAWISSIEWTIFSINRRLPLRKSTVFHASAYAASSIGLLFGYWLTSRYLQANYIESFAGFFGLVAMTEAILKKTDDFVRAVPHKEIQ